MKRVTTIWNSASTMSSESHMNDSERVNRAMRQESASSGMWMYWPRNTDWPELDRHLPADESGKEVLHPQEGQHGVGEADEEYRPERGTDDEAGQGGICIGVGLKRTLAGVRYPHDQENDRQSVDRNLNPAPDDSARFERGTQRREAEPADVGEQRRQSRPVENEGHEEVGRERQRDPDDDSGEGSRHRLDEARRRGSAGHGLTRSGSRPRHCRCGRCHRAVAGIPVNARSFEIRIGRGPTGRRYPSRALCTCIRRALGRRIPAFAGKTLVASTTTVSMASFPLSRE